MLTPDGWMDGWIKRKPTIFDGGIKFNALSGYQNH